MNRTKQRRIHNRTLNAAAEVPADRRMSLTGSLRILVAAADDGSQKKPSFELSAYNGGPMNVRGWYYPVIVDAEGVTPAASDLPVYCTHEELPENLVGQTRRLKIGEGKIDASGDLTASRDSSRTYAQMLDHAANGYKWQCSIGADVQEYEFCDEGKSVRVNGQSYSGPVFVSRKTNLSHIAIVPLGADTSTKATIAATNGGKETPTMLITFEKWIAAQGKKMTDLNETQKASLQAAYDSLKAANALPDAPTESPAPATPPAPATQPAPAPTATAGNEVINLRAAHAAELERINAVQTAAKGHPTIAAQAVKEGWSVEKTELETLRASRAPESTAPAIIARGGERVNLDTETVTASLCATAGMSEKFIAEQVPADRRERVMNAASSGSLRGFSLHALMDLVCHSAGQPFLGNRKSDDFIRAAMSAERTIRAAGGFSSISLSGILSNVANQAMVASYQAQEVVWPYIAGVRSHGDFKVHTRYRLDATGAFKKVGPDGELKHVGLSEASYTNQLDTFGAIISLTRQMQINDDLGAFMEIPNLLGRMSAIRKEEAVFVLLLANPANFFHADNKNYLSGAASALAITGLTSAVQKFSDQVDSNKKPILTSPSILLVGTALRTAAEDLYKEKLLNEATAAKPAQTPNPHVGLYRPYVSPYLNNTAIKDQDGAAITGQSASKWYLMANPAVRAAIAIAFLNGKQTPTIESSDAEFNTLGMQWRAYDDFGVGMEDTVAAVLSAGL